MSVDGVKEGIMLTWMREQETEVEEFHVGCPPGGILLKRCSLIVRAPRGGGNAGLVMRLW
jgi:hypothetical protein